MKNPILSLLFIAVSCCLQAQNMNLVQPAFLELQAYPNIRDFTLSNTGDEAYFSIQSHKGDISAIAKIMKINNQWSSPQTASFSGNYFDLEPFLSPDNLTLYFASSRPKSDDKVTKDFDIWYVERVSIKAPWGAPVNMGTIVNSDKNEFYPSVAANKNIYFTSDRIDSKGKDDIFFSIWNGQAYEAPESMGSSINSQGYEFNAFISPSESFLIFSGYNRADGIGSADLYISRRTHNFWSKAVNFGSIINSDKMDYCPFVDIKNKTLYFTSQRSSIDLETAGKNSEAFLKELNKYENGMSRLYSIGLETIIHINE